MVTACLPVERGDYEIQLRTAGFVDVRISDSSGDSVDGVIIEGQKAD